MNNAIKWMLDKYQCATSEEYKNALKEIIQEIALLGLSRAKFFEYAAFYGGTALRILYGIDRFSEDLDFSLLNPDKMFDIDPYCKFIRDELAAFGFKVTVEKKEKSFKSAVESAFIKGNTLIHLLQIEGLNNPESGTNKNEMLKIKFEVDTDPPQFAGYDVRYLLNPIPFSVKCYDLPSMFAGKMHAFLCRNPQSVRIKGRDIFDLVWFVSQKTELNFKHLEGRMKQTDDLSVEENLDRKKLVGLLIGKVESLDIERAKLDVMPFIKDPFAVEVWSKEFLKDIIKKIV